MSKVKYVSTKKATEILGVGVLTLHNWEKKGKIETIRSAGNHRLYNVEKYLQKQKNGKDDDSDDGDDEKDDNIDKKNICYIRVSNVGDKKNLKEQKEYIKKKYPEHVIIEDIGSSNNFDKEGIKKIIDMIQDKSVNDIITINKTAMNKYCCDMLSYLLKKNGGGKISVDERTAKEKGITEKVTTDMIDDLCHSITSCLSELSEMKKMYAQSK